MSTMRAVIVDDEALARRRLGALLRDHGDVEVVAECGTGREAVAALRRARPDVVFLDIQMPGMDGFGVIEEIGAEEMPAVVFVTAYDEHALRAFDVNALDYLLKPFDEKRLAAALARVRRRMGARAGGEGAIRKRLLGAISVLAGARRGRSRLAVRSGGRIRFVATDEIDWIEADGKYVKLHAGRETHLHRAVLGQVEAALDPREFARIHRSTIVRVGSIKELQPLFHGEYVVILRDGTELTLSRGYRGKLRELIGGSE